MSIELREIVEAAKENLLMRMPELLAPEEMLGRRVAEMAMRQTHELFREIFVMLPGRIEIDI